MKENKEFGFDNWLAFCDKNNISSSAFKVGLDFATVYSREEFFDKMVESWNNSRGLGNISEPILEEIKAALNV